MNWEAVGAIAEIVASVGVILSLIYLGLQIRSQNTESRIASANELVTQYLTANRDLSRDRELAELMLNGFRDFESLRDAERLRFSAYMTGIWRFSEAMYQQRKSGRLDESVWRGHRKSIEDLCLYPGVKSWWRTREKWFSDDYRSLVAPMMARAEEPKSYGEDE